MINDNGIIPCSRFTRIETQLTLRSIPPYAISEKELKRYLHLCIYAHDKYGRTLYGYKDFNKVCKCSSHEFKRITERLEGMKFIKATPLKHTYTEYTVYTLPYYDPDEEKFVTVLDCPRTGYAFEANHIHFTVVPTEALLKALQLPRQVLMVLLKLYRYNNFQVFRGVDPNVIQVKSNEFIIHSKLPYDLYMTADDFIYCIRELIDKGFIIMSDVSLELESFDYEKRYRVVEGDTVKVITPIYQWEGALSNET